MLDFGEHIRSLGVAPSMVVGDTAVSKTSTTIGSQRRMGLRRLSDTLGPDLGKDGDSKSRSRVRHDTPSRYL